MAAAAAVTIMTTTTMTTTMTTTSAAALATAHMRSRFLNRPRSAFCCVDRQPLCGMTLAKTTSTTSTTTTTNDAMVVQRRFFLSYGPASIQQKNQKTGTWTWTCLKTCRRMKWKMEARFGSFQKFDCVSFFSAPRANNEIWTVLAIGFMTPT